MIDPKKIEQIARQVHESMPKGLRDLGKMSRKRSVRVLQSQLTRPDLVSREEFDVQTQVLLRTRETGAAGAANQRSGKPRGRPTVEESSKTTGLTARCCISVPALAPTPPLH